MCCFLPRRTFQPPSQLPQFFHRSRELQTKQQLYKYFSPSNSTPRFSLFRQEQALGGRHLIFFFFCLFSRAAPTSYGGSQVRGLIGAVAAGLRQGHNNAGSKLHL